VTIEVCDIDLTREMQNWASRAPSLEQRAGGVGRSRAGAGEGDAERSGDAAKRIRHVDGACFAARWNKSDAITPPDRIEHRHIVNAAHAECSDSPALLEECRHHIPASHVGLIHQQWPIGRNKKVADLRRVPELTVSRGQFFAPLASEPCHVANAERHVIEILAWLLSGLRLRAGWALVSLGPTP
jgi:hypothetical protein